MTLSFDKIKIPQGELKGDYRPEEFVKLPVIKRVREIMAKNIIFLKNGLEIDRTTALNELRKWTASQA